MPPERTRQDVRKRPVWGREDTIDASVPRIAAFYGLNRTKLALLAEKLWDISCLIVDDSLGEDGPQPDQGRRRRAYEAAVELRSAAQTMSTSLHLISENFGKLWDVTRHNRYRLNHVYELKEAEEPQFDFPEELTILKTFFEDVDIASLQEQLNRLADLPIRQALPRGLEGNGLLRVAIAACRYHWREIEGRSWTQSALKNKVTRESDSVANLQGECEAFVADMLQICDIPFTLRTLASAWTEIDRASR